MSLIPNNPRPRPGLTDEYRCALDDLAGVLPEDPHDDLDAVAEWMTRHGWRTTDFSPAGLQVIGDVLAAVHMEMTLLLIEETPTEEVEAPSPAPQPEPQPGQITGLHLCTTDYPNPRGTAGGAA